MDGIEPTVQEISDRFVRQFELAAADRHRDRAMRATSQFTGDVMFWFFANPRLPDSEPIGYLLPINCVRPMAESGIITAGDFRQLTRVELMQVPNVGRNKAQAICASLARFGIAPRKNVP